MRLRGVRQSRNVEDRRGRRAGGAAGLGGAGLLVVLAIAYFTGIDVSPLLQQQPGATSGGPVQLSAEEEQAGVFASQVLATTEDVWTDIFAEEFGATYQPPRLVLFSEVTQSGCGGASGSSGPFYCPADERAYLDTAFFAFMAQRLGARGDFAAAYVIAHEVAHHVQHELGILGQANQARAAMSQTDSNRVSVMIELQADCLSGVWASRLDGILEPGDIEEAIGTAEVIGDDYLQARAGRQPNPHSFTHGTSEQRMRWFVTGYQSGDPAACDTFGAARL
ncbi:neutral zinc metallopeptidase [Roseibacterium sp. SDUM158016]|uniref:KPN_02809 family neutral zinc metallopeptidase n=1 Tax=Roseicyclus sediminis TaxID=2980997 RepID=UPI0021D198CE|nr:neutral zinc metallopeptidase [Roseibacterium sp. SDUM158016]MCU4654127.1 neutral zinc metallopeptidase [Roseibacterium sp. SDUM158016]